MPSYPDHPNSDLLERIRLLLVRKRGPKRMQHKASIPHQAGAA